MPEWHRNNKFPFYLKSTTGHTQRECSQPPLSGGRRAPPVVPGRIPLREEAELFLGVTKAPAEPETGAIPLGHLNFTPDGFSHPMSDSDNIPLRYTNNHNNLVESDYKNSAPFRGLGQLSGDSGDISMGSASGFIGDGIATKEGAKESTNTFETPTTDSFLNSSIINSPLGRTFNPINLATISI